MASYNPHANPISVQNFELMVETFEQMLQSIADQYESAIQSVDPSYKHGFATVDHTEDITYTRADGETVTETFDFELEVEIPDVCLSLSAVVKPIEKYMIELECIASDNGYSSSFMARSKRLLGRIKENS